MPGPRWLARSNRFAANRIALPIAGWMPGMGVVRHVGRKSGKPYRTPVLIFRQRGGYLIALTYGPESEWPKNVLAAAGCEVELRGKVIKLTNPAQVHDPDLVGALPAPLRPILTAMNVADFLALEDAPATP